MPDSAGVLPQPPSPLLRWQDDGAIRFLIAGPWITYVLDQVTGITLHGLQAAQAPNLVACAAGLAATMAAIMRWRYTRALTVSACAIFFAAYGGVIGLWLDTRTSTGGMASMAHWWHTTLDTIDLQLHGGQVAAGITLAYRTLVMPLFQAAIAVVFVLTRRPWPANRVRANSVRRRRPGMR